MNGRMSQSDKPRTVRAFFDDYVRRDFPQRRAPDGSGWRWPGDEWVSGAVRDATYELLLRQRGTPWREVVEIGPGSGKYTDMLLAQPGVHLTAFEISPAFIDSLKERCAAHVEAGRLDARLIDWTANDGLLKALGARAGAIDLFFGIDVFLMMDFQSALVYLLSAALVLRPGGVFAGTFGDADSESGWARMVRDIGRHSGFDDAPCTRFHWVGHQMLRASLERLGFAVRTLVSGPEGAARLGPLDIARIYVVAELIDPEPSRALKASLFPS